MIVTFVRMQRFGPRFGLFVLTIWNQSGLHWFQRNSERLLPRSRWKKQHGVVATVPRWGSWGVGSFCTYAGLFCLPKWPVRHGETLEFMMKMSVMSISFLMLIEVWTSQKRVLFSGGSLCWAGACLPSKCARGCMAWRYTERNGLSMVSKRMAGADLWSIADFVMFGLVLFLRRVVILFRKLCKRSGHLRLASGDCLQFS